MNAVDLEYGLQYMFNEWFILSLIHIYNLYFAHIDGPEVQKGKVNVTLTVKRTSRAFELSFQTEGMVSVCLLYTSTPATVKLKGIDGGPHKRRNMWFNSMIREEPYPGLNCK